MSRFSTKVPTPTTATINAAGGRAFQESPKLELVTFLLNSFVQSSFYSSKDKLDDRFKELVRGIPDKKFIAQASIFARNEFGMRTITHMAAGELATMISGEEWAKRYFEKVVARPDDMIEIVAYFLANGGSHTLTNAMKKGFASAFGRFDAYQLAKYKKEGHEISLVDVMRLVHPKATEKNREGLEKLVKGELKNENTWEAQVSAAGRTEAVAGKTKEEAVAEAKKDAWAEMITSGRIGYTALLRNLRNILKDAPEVQAEALALLTKEKLIRGSKVFPFQFMTAHTELKKEFGSQKILSAISRALDISVANVPKFEGNTCVVVDVSSSMRSNGVADKAALFASILVKANECDLILFEGDARYETVDPAQSVLGIRESIASKMHGGSTNFHSVFQTMRAKYDTIVLLSDMQGWVEGGYGQQPLAVTYADYRKKFGATPKLFSFDLAHEGTLQFPESSVYCVAGFSEKVFDLMNALLKDKQAMIHLIEKIEL